MAIDTLLEPVRWPGGLGGTVVLTGVAASGGWASGRARVLTTPGEMQLGRGEILVLPDLRSAWWPLFCAAGGVVVVRGAILAAAATLAREYGLPMVVGVAGAMQRIASGQPITVDGRRGLVYLGSRHDLVYLGGETSRHRSTLAY
jgi:rifampicin phosphotransferase